MLHKRIVTQFNETGSGERQAPFKREQRSGLKTVENKEEEG